MDRSYLSHESVVAASRNFVCIRLATYEDQKEADFMRSIFIGRSGELENTTFGILAPDGKRKLATPGRGPMHAYRSSASMAAGMNQIADQYADAKKAALMDKELPMMKNLDVALNVAAADGLPLIVAVGGSEQLKRVRKQLVPLAWSEDLAGQFVYVAVTDKKKLKPLVGTKEGSILVIEPGQFGLSGRIVARFSGSEKHEAMRNRLKQIVAQLPRLQKSHDSHVRLGIQLGIDWKSQIPETDPMSLRARAQVRGNR